MRRLRVWVKVRVAQWMYNWPDWAFDLLPTSTIFWVNFHARRWD